MDSSARLLVQHTNPAKSPIEEARLAKLVQSSVDSLEYGSLSNASELISVILEKLQASSSSHKFIVSVNTIVKNEDPTKKPEEQAETDITKHESCSAEEHYSDQNVGLEKIASCSPTTEKNDLSIEKNVSDDNSNKKISDEHNDDDECLENKETDNEISIVDEIQEQPKESISGKLHESSNESESKDDADGNNELENQDLTGDRLDTENDEILSDSEVVAKEETVEERAEETQEEKKEENQTELESQHSTTSSQKDAKESAKDKFTLKSSIGSVWNEEKDGLVNYKITSQNIIYLITVIWVSTQ